MLHYSSLKRRVNIYFFYLIPWHPCFLASIVLWYGSGTYLSHIPRRLLLVLLNLAWYTGQHERLHMTLPHA